jgi:hypothetical protein
MHTHSGVRSALIDKLKEFLDFGYQMPDRITLIINDINLGFAGQNPSLPLIINDLRSGV